MHKGVVVVVLFASLLVCCSLLTADPLDANNESPIITLNAPHYDIGKGDIECSGTSNTAIVNIRLYSLEMDEYVSTYNALIVNDGAFKGYYHVGSLPIGNYRLDASYNEIVVSQPLVINGEFITIDHVGYSEGELQYDGQSNSGLINAAVYGEGGYKSVYIPSIPVSGHYSERVYIGELLPGSYMLIITGSVSITSETFTIGGNDPYISDSVYSNDGKILYEYHGNTQEYVLPSHVEYIASGAFDESTIEKFVLTKDVEWEIEIVNNTFPLQNAHILELEISEGVTVIPDYLFACTDISEVIIPSSIRSIGVKSFYLCNNLRFVAIENDSRMELIGRYAFSNNSNLSDVEIGSSEDGYSCSLDTGCFFNTGLKCIRINPDFDLYSIGDACFANCNQFSILIGDESGKKVHIPGTVGYLGHSAFTSIQKSTSTVEPGRNTIYGLTGYSLENYPEETSDYELVFDDNVVLTRIEYKCFRGMPFKSIDLSGCHCLETVGKGAFLGCLCVGNTNLILSPSIKILEDGAFRCNGSTSKLGEKNTNGEWIFDETFVIPAHIESIGQYALEGISAKISFEENSSLKILNDMSPVYGLYRQYDLTNCKSIQLLATTGSGSEITLPTGVLIVEKAPLLRASPDSKKATIVNNRLTIEADTKVICFNYDSYAKTVEWLTDQTEIDCSPDNPFFRYEGGVLSFTNEGCTKIIYITDAKTVSLGPEFGDNTELTQYSLSPQLRTLYLGNPKMTIDGGILSSSSNVKHIFVTAVPERWDIPSVLSEMPLDVKIYVTDNLPSSDIDYLKSKGEVYIGYNTGSKIIYVPTSWKGVSVTLTDIIISESSLDASITVEGKTLNEMDFVTLGANTAVTGNRIHIGDFDSSNMIIVTVHEALTYSNSNIEVRFDGNGGMTESGRQSVTIFVKDGTIINESLMPSFFKNSYRADGWVDENNQVVCTGFVVKKNVILTQRWQLRNPLIEIDSTAAIISVNGINCCDNIEYSGESLTIVAQSRAGYELNRWIVNGEDCGSAKEPLILNGILVDTNVSISYVNYSQSSGLKPINNTGMPTSDEISKIVQSYVVGGYVDTTMSTWKGTSSVPLVVDNYIYLRIAEKIYKIESDTGYVVRSVDSESRSTFYHQLGYGGGAIIDYHTSKVYDLDLNQIYILDRAISGAEYFDGKFYTSGVDVYSFTSNDDDVTTSSELKHLTKIGTVANSYTSYGFSTSCFVDHYMYRITALGNDRGLAAMDLDSGAVSYTILSSLRSMYLDDGWISYCDGYIFITGYTQGLFGSVAKPGCSILAYLPVSGLSVESDQEKYIEFNKSYCGADLTGFSSQFVVYEKRGFVDISGRLFVFDLPESMINLDLNALNVRSVPFVYGHGSIVLDVSHINEPGAPVYIYGIPYDTHQNSTLGIAMDCGGVLSSNNVYSAPREWNSQAIRSDLDGRMIWYNDSGWVYSYTTSDKNVYYFFIEDGDSAIWYRAYGANAADALASLGDNVATLNAAKIIQTVNGHSVVDGMTLQMLKATYGTTDNNGQFNNLDQYSWVTITNLGDSSYSLNHYFRIICGNGSSVSSGDVFTYMDNGETKTYTFADNIGDRSIIGKQLSRGTDVVYIRFVEDNTEIPGTASIVKRGSEAKVHFPEVVKVGYVPIWKNASGEEVADIYGQTLSSDATFHLSWQELPAGYIISGTMDVSDGVTTWSADVDIRTGIGTTDGLSIKVTAVTSDGRVLTDIKTTGTNGLASGSLNAANIRLMYIRIVDEHVEGNLGYVMIEREATA